MGKKISKELKCNFPHCRFKCGRDNFKFTNHQRTHTGEKPFECKLCGKSFSQKASLGYHIASHTGEKPIKCPQDNCHFACLTVTGLRIHSLVHTKEKPYSCQFCGVRFARKEYLEYHIHRHTGEKQYNCQFCEYKTASGGSLNVHVKRHSGSKPFKCEFDQCNYATITQTRLRLHQKSHSTETPYGCSICKKKFKTQQSQRKHLTRIHDFDHQNEQKPHKCPHFSCPYRAWYKSLVQKHFHNAHVDPEEKAGQNKKYKCQICNKYSTDRRDHWDSHMRIHSGEKLFECPLLCGKRMSQNSSLILHIRVHTGERPYKCQVDKCPFAGINKYALSRHIKTKHEPKTFYLCPQEGCPFKTLKSSMVEAHVKRHDRACPICKIKIQKPSHLRYHILTIHGGQKKFTCPKCSAGFSYRRDLTRHQVLKGHSDEVGTVTLRSGRKKQPPIFHCTVRLHCKFVTESKTCLIIHHNERHSIPVVCLDRILLEDL